MDRSRQNLFDKIPTTYLQARTIAEHLLSIGDISIRECMDLYHVSSVTKVMSDLRKKYEFPIYTHRKRDNNQKLYVRYCLAA